jgi:hypothetical protein
MWAALHLQKQAVLKKNIATSACLETALSTGNL